jgi:hypothetical protein
MGKLLILVIPCLLAWSAVRVWGMFKSDEKPKELKAEKAAGAGASKAAVKDDAIRKARFAYKRERWLAVSRATLPRYVNGVLVPGSQMYVKTEGGHYIVGELSVHGLVESIRWPDPSKSFAIVRCLDAEGGVVYVVAEHIALPAAVPTMAALAGGAQ